ncbi:MAG: hypothetical protein J7530_06170 [Novosphingobium sp.]|nr:hypothetical protein [Novosphingobium sp.]
MPLIERAARALAESESGHDAWRQLDPELREELKENVRAVIRAMREPTLRMCMAGHELFGHACGPTDSEDAHGAGQAMIDAALSSPKPITIRPATPRKTIRGGAEDGRNQQS